MPLLEENRALVSEKYEDEYKQRLFLRRAKFGFFGCLVFLVMVLVADISAEPYKEITSVSYLVGFVKNAVVCIACGLVVGMIPWGRKWMYFLYGFLLPLAMTLIILLFAE